MTDQPKTIHSIRANLDAAADELRTALDGITQAQAALQHIQDQDDAQRIAELNALWQDLAHLSNPIVNTGVHIIGAMREIGQQTGASPHAPNQMEWLGGIDVRARHANQEMQQRATTLLEWLEPYLMRVSPRTRTAVTQAITKSAHGHAPREFVEQLTPETFLRDLHHDHAGLVANIPGLGPRGLRELREAVVVDDTQPSTS